MSTFTPFKTDKIETVNPIREYLLNIQFKEKVQEKHPEQLNYIVAPITENIYLETCASSGKTEFVDMKAAYKMSKWQNNGGMAILTFTNEATNTVVPFLVSYAVSNVKKEMMYKE